MNEKRYEQKSQSSFNIQYIIIGKRQPAISILPPEEFNNEFLQTISLLPQNITQLDSPINYIVMQWETLLHSGYDISYIYEDSTDDFTMLLSNRQITVIFVDKEVESKSKFISKFKEMGYFYYVYSTESNNQDTFSNYKELIQLFFSDKEEIEKHFLSLGLDIHFNFPIEFPEDFNGYNKYEFFIPSAGNTKMINQYISNFYYEEQEGLKLSREENESIVKNHAFTLNRLDILIKQIDKIDTFREISSNGIPFVNKYKEPIAQYSPLIIVAPFQYPQIENVIPLKAKSSEFQIYRESFKAEQDVHFNVSTAFDEEYTNQDIIKSLQVTAGNLSSRLKYLDTIAYFQASFTFSPIVRFPLKGRSLNKYLSFFDPSKSGPDRRKIYKTIKKFGEEFSKQVISQSNSKQLFSRNRQIIAISDLPFEWIHNKGIPLSVTHDVTRIPELPYSGIMANYVKNSAIRYVIPENVLEKTLIILGENSDASFDIGFKHIEENSQEYGYKTLRCNSVDLLQKTIEEFEPHIIIFDTHGMVDAITKSSYLKIGNEKLTGDLITKKHIVAPIIVLSACNTSPNWGYINNITQAFFEAGAISITGTFFPIGILSGTVFYNRILINLKSAQNEKIHDNWLSFISHTIRTHYLSETAIAACNKIYASNLDNKTKEDTIILIKNTIAKLMTMSMQFSNRRYVYENIEKEMQSIHPILKNKIFNIPFEQLIYTNLGRGDLIFFDSWKKGNKIPPYQQVKLQT